MIQLLNHWYHIEEHIGHILYIYNRLSIIWIFDNIYFHVYKANFGDLFFLKTPTNVASRHPKAIFLWQDVHAVPWMQAKSKNCQLSLMAMNDVIIFFYLVAMATIQIVWDCLEWLLNYWCTATIAGRCYPNECKLNSPIIFYLKNNNKTVALRLMALEAPVVSDYSWSITLPPFMSCRDCVWGSHCGCLVVCRHWQAGHSPGGSWRHPHLTPDTCVLPAHWRLPRRLPHPHSSGAC